MTSKIVPTVVRNALVTEFVTATYENEIPPGNSLRFKLWFDDSTGDGWQLVDGRDALSASPSVSFQIEVSGAYRVTCQRLTIESTGIGPVAYSNNVYIGSGEYLAPLTITFGVV